MRSKIPYSRQWVDNKDIQEVVKVLKSDWLTQGDKIREFEEALCQYTGVNYAVAVSSGTAALHLACKVAGVGPGDEGITSPLSFVASANAILYSGGHPIFADIDFKTGNIDPLEIKKKITKKTKVLIPIHFSGYPCAMEEIYKIGRKHKLIIIEDAAHALGAKYKGSKVGSCQYSDMTIFSFHPLKSITTGEGGAILTNNKKFYETLKQLRTHGITKSQKTEKIGPWYYEMNDLGFNYRITDIQSALGISQLKKVNSFINKRKMIAEQYDEAFKDLKNVMGLDNKQKGCSSYHLYVLLINFNKLKTTRKQLMLSLQNKGIGTQVHYIPIYKQPYFKKNFKINNKEYPNTEQFYKQCLSIPIYPSMTQEDINRVIATLRNALK